MPWTPPSDPVTSTVITVAYAVANLLTQIRWLRGMTGNADPPGTSYVVVADTTSTTSWRKVPADALAAGAAVGNLGYTPVNKAGDTVNGPLVVTGAVLTANNGILVPSGNVTVQTGNVSAASGVSVTGGGVAVQGGGGVNVTQNTGLPDANLGTRAGLTAHTTDSSRPAINFSRDGTGFAALYYESGIRLRVINNGGVEAGIVLDTDPTATATPNAIPRADALGTLDAWITPGGTPGPHNHSGDALIPATLNGAQASATAGPGRIPIADASGKLDAWISPSGLAGVPSGLIALWAASDTAPTGWVIDTTFRDRFAVGAGGLYARSTTAGAVTHDHGITLGHSGGGVAADASTPIRVQVSGTGTDPQAPQSGHGHAYTQPGAHGITNQNANHLPPYIAAHYIRKT